MNEFYPKLFEPFNIGTCEIPNRVTLVPMLLEVAELDGENCTQEKILAIIAEGSAAAGGEVQ